MSFVEHCWRESNINTGDGGQGGLLGEKSSWDQMTHPEDSRVKIVKFL